MRTPSPVPVHLASRAFARDEALAAGITARMLQHARFESIFPSVYRVRGVELTSRQWIDAARRALPTDARLSHATALWSLGLELGQLTPMHFTVGRDLHLAIDDIVLHRTEVMPPSDDRRVSAEAALVGAAVSMRLIDVIAAGDWLLNRGYMTKGSVAGFIERDGWRPGTAVVREAITLMDEQSRSIKESETRCVLVCAGLQVPEVNLDVFDDHGVFLGCGDLVYRRWKFLIEYEGRQHAMDPAQFASDIDRYARWRADGWEYLQVIKSRLDSPRSLVRQVHRVLIDRGYDGPAPVFGARWDRLFAAGRGRAIRGVAA